MNKLIATYKKKPIVPVGLVNGAIGLEDEEFSSTEESDMEDEVNYEEDFVSKEMQRYAKCNTEGMVSSSMSEVEGIQGIDHKNNPLSVYACYNFSRNVMKKELPIDSFKEKILNMLAVNSVVIIQGPTGCGKTTQVPQYILDHCRENKEFCNIAVTQPRKLATITVAKRVCEERGWPLGTVCGYQVGLEKKLHPDMLLTYMTTGVLLQKLILAKHLHHYTHIIIDEIHERNQDLDFLMLIVRRFLFTNSLRTKLILMSATIEAKEFAHYFRSQVASAHIPAPIINITKQSIYTKSVFYLDSILSAIELRPDSFGFDVDRPEISLNMWRTFTVIVGLMDKLDPTDPDTKNPIIGSLLVFLPGIYEIEEAMKQLNTVANARKSGTTWKIIPLHSSLPNDEQQKAFQPVEPGCRKIILSTNIAESSITISDTCYVIDFCQTKVLTVDPITKFNVLKLEWASHVNCEQRAGRVGRVASGRVYRLVTEKFYMECLQTKGDPEIVRAPLEQTVLKAKMLNFNESPQQVLALAMNPPNLRSIEATILNLKETGGLLQTCRGKYSQSDGDITFLGVIMARLPIDIRLSKLIVLGYLFSCLRETIIMAAGASIQNIFASPFRRKINSYKMMFLWADGSFSDMIALLNLFNIYQSFKRERKFEKAEHERNWCNEHFVNLRGLREWNELVLEIQLRLASLNIREIPRQIQLDQAERSIIFKVVTAGAFYPNFFIRQPEATQMSEEQAVKIVGGRNPFRTVYLTGIDSRQPCPIYISAIKDMFKNEKGAQRDMAVGFDGSSKIYVEFSPYNQMKEQVTVSIGGQQMITDHIPGKIATAVYEAIKKRQIKDPFRLVMLPLSEAWEFAEENGIEHKSTLQKMEKLSNAANFAFKDRNLHCTTEEFSPLPSLDTLHITLKVTEFIDAGNFFANTIDSEPYLVEIHEILNRQVLSGVLKSNEKIYLGKVYAAKYNEDNKFYRCRVISYSPNMTQVIFIDYGNVQQVHPKDLYLLPNIRQCHIAPLGIECMLRGVKPSISMNPKGVWTTTINEFWRKQMYGFLLHGLVHSVVDKVVYLELYKTEPMNPNVKSLNQQMIEMKHAEPAIDSFLSKADNEKRVQVLKADNPNLEAFRLGFDQIESYQDFKSPITLGHKCTEVELKGPFSPLEMKLYGLTESSLNKQIGIENNSINSVLLDNEPDNPHSRLLVANYVSQNVSGDRLTLRTTTLMPNIPGLPMILSLLFCPTMRTKVTNDGSRVASILCGLGYNMYTEKAYHPTHDFSLTLDTELTEGDINKINEIRFYLNRGVRLMNEISQELANPEEMLKLQVVLKKDLISLINSPKKPVPRQTVSFANVWCKSSKNVTEMKPTKTDNLEDIWPLLGFVTLKSGDKDYGAISKNLDDLSLAAKQIIPSDNLGCLLCNVRLDSLNDIRLHLISTAHKEMAEKFTLELL